MKERAVSALRIERGLRTETRNAEPQVVGLAPQTTVMTERANTMKTYILRDLQPVEAQKTVRPTRSKPRPAPAAMVNSKPTLFIGLDVHNDTIAVSPAPSASCDCRHHQPTRLTRAC